jgi:hypothetical protein
VSDNRSELIEQIRMEVAKRHNVLLSTDDPIFAFVTVNELLLDHYITQIDKRLQASNEHALTAAAGLTEGAKQTASRLITEGSNYIRQQAIDAFNEARKGGNSEAAQIVAKAIEAVDEARSIRTSAFWAAVIAALAASAAIGLALGLALK